MMITVMTSDDDERIDEDRFGRGVFPVTYEDVRYQKDTDGHNRSFVFLYSRILTIHNVCCYCTLIQVTGDQ